LKMDSEEETPTASEYVEQLKAVLSRREELSNRRTRLEVIKEQSDAQFKEYKGILEDLGTSPGTAEADLTTAREDLSKEIKKLDKELDDYDEKMTNAEKVATEIDEEG